MTSEAFRKSTCSPELVAGPAPSGSPVGMTRDLFGQAHVRASRSVSPESARVKPTHAISGLNTCASSASVALQRALESKWLEQTASLGPMGWQKTLKRKVMPSGRSYCQVTLSAPLKTGNEFILLPTLPSQMQQGGPQMYGGTGAYHLWKRILGRLPRGSREMLALGSWMMGYQPSWLKVFLEISETQSSPTSPRNSSRQRKKPLPQPD